MLAVVLLVCSAILFIVWAVGNYYGAGLLVLVLLAGIGVVAAGSLIVSAILGPKQRKRER
jgi:fucose permease